MTEAARQEPQRLARRVASLVPCSRTEAERYITGGWVKVDGQVVDRPEARVRDHQQVSVDPMASAEPLPPATVLWHKPAGVAVPDALQLPTGLALQWFDAPHRCAAEQALGALPRAQLHRLQPLLPLTIDVAGLMVLTQHPAISRRLTEGARDLEQEWFADLAPTEEPATAEARAAWLAAAQRARTDEARRHPPLRASWQSDARLRIAAKGWTAQALARHLAAAGVPVAQLRRQRIGRVGLSGLAAGQWRQLGIGERF
jgi:23S rRNA pseudouridine2604 synthase